MFNYLNDFAFLEQLTKLRVRTIYARLIALTQEELPIETIEGKITLGSINVDGNSAIRRTCSLTLITDKFDYSDYIWTFKTKFKLEVGLANTINPDYPDICWFKQGTYVIASINVSHSTNNLTISIQGKDKMCLLDGSISGSLEAQTDFGKIEEEDINGNWNIRSIPIPVIIRNIVHHYGHEPLQNIMLNDLDTYGLELLEYRHEMPIYMIRLNNETSYHNLIFNREVSVSTEENNWQNTTLDELTYDYFDTMTSDSDMAINGKQLYFDNDDEAYYAAKLEYGMTAGYRKTELTYAGDLIGNVGESLVSILDKIQKMLVEFEFFYDIDGFFVFLKKRSYLNTLWSDNTILETPLLEYNNSNILYKFNDTKMFTAFSNTPNIANVRNDFSIWGERKGISGASIPIHYRYAIDKKPIEYCNIGVTLAEVDEYNNKYGTNLQPLLSNDKWWIASDTETFIGSSHNLCDWREVIYQMALDYFKYNWLDDFEVRVAKANPSYYPTGKTGYEQYYTDLQGFWRQLYNPDIEQDIAKYDDDINKIDDSIIKIEGNSIGDYSSYPISQLPKDNLAEVNVSLSIIETRLESLVNLLHNLTEKFYKTTSAGDKQAVKMTDLIAMLRDIELLKTAKTLFEQTKLNYENNISNLNSKKEELQSQMEVLESSKKDYNIDGAKTDMTRYWHRHCFSNPELLNFWFDFLDVNGELSEFSVLNIGPRPKAINDNNIKSIYYRDIPSVIFTEDIQTESNLDTSAFGYIQVDSIDEMFSISTQGASAKDKLNDLLYQHGYINESINITCIPIYYLLPNYRIYVRNEENQIDGEYIVSKLTIPLTYNGTMSITASKAAEYLI